MHFGACIGFTNTTTFHDPGNTNDDHDKPNNYTGKKFFEDKNYQSALERLNDGYNDAKNRIQAMVEYHDIEQTRANNLTSYSNKWNTQLKQQSSLSFYHTTKRAQLQTIRAPEDHAILIRNSCKEMQKVINDSHKQVNEMYPHKRFHRHRKHYRVDEMEKLFEDARSPLRRALHELEQAEEHKKTIYDALQKANTEYETLLSSTSTVNQKKLTRARENQQKKEKELKDTEDNITLLEQKCQNKAEIYRKNAADIFQQCQKLEEERLSQIQQTLMNFNRAIYSSEYSTELDTLSTNLISNILSQQNTTKDLIFWAQTYGINDLNNHPTESDTIESNE